MSARSFRSVFMVASCAGAALGCYLVSLRVASERAALQEVETQIVMAERDIRLLKTEIGTRGRLAQLERWNVKVLALSAPTADQFVDGGFALARLVRPQPRNEMEAPVVFASAPADAAGPQLSGTAEGQADRLAEPAAEDLLHLASLKQPERAGSASIEMREPTTDKAASARSRKESGEAPAKKAGDKRSSSASASVTKNVKTASVDPLAPLPTASSPRSSKDTDSLR